MKPVEPQSLLDFDLGEGESSDDSDFRIEDHPEESDDYSINTDDDDKSKLHTLWCYWAVQSFIFLEFKVISTEKYSRLEISH